MKVVFFDTNVIYSSYIHFIKGKTLTTSLIELSRIHTFYVSTYVIGEIINKVCINEGILTSLSDFNRFCEIILFERFESNPSHDVFLDFVHDPNDADILQDAVDIEADILLTRNLKDFKIDMIFSTFGIQVTNHLDL